MKKKLIITSLLCLYGIILRAQGVNHSQTLYDLTVKHDFFNAREYKHQHGDSIIREIHFVYDYKMHRLCNRLDSAAVYLERMLDECPILFPNEFTVLDLYNELINLYMEIGDYQKVIDTYNRVEQLLLTAPFGNDSIKKKQQLALIAQAKIGLKEWVKVPQMKVFNLSGAEEASVEFVQDPIITTTVELNGEPLKSWIDTGWENYLFLNKAFADKCRIRYIPSLTDSLPINGVMARANMGIVDSVKIGSILFTNVPALVVYDKFSSLLPASLQKKEIIAKYDSAFSAQELIVGLPLLRKLGSFELDMQNKKMNMRLRSKVRVNDEDPNMFIDAKKIYASVLINDIRYIGFLDTGAAQVCVDLNPAFYEKYKNDIPLDEQQQVKTQNSYGIAIGVQNMEYRTALTPRIVFASKPVRLGNNGVIVWAKEQSPYWRDGMIGYAFIKQLGSKVKFDFVNMRVTAE